MKKILLAILGLTVHGISFIICKLIIGGFLSLLFKLPLIGAIVGFLLRDTSGAFLIDGLSMFLSVCAMSFVLEKSAHDDALMDKTVLIIAWTITVVHSISLILNLIYRDAIYTNIVFLITAWLLRYGVKN